MTETCCMCCKPFTLKAFGPSPQFLAGQVDTRVAVYSTFLSRLGFRYNADIDCVEFCCVCPACVDVFITWATLRDGA